MREELWTEVEPSQFAHEREALDFVRRRLPDREPWRAWSNFTFIDTNGRPAEVDLLVVAPRGVVLVEIKSYPDGVLDGDAGTWRWTPPGKPPRSYDNPFYAADAKAKRLKSLLLAQRALRGSSAPRNVNKLWVSAAVFLSSPQLTVKLNERGRNEVYGPDPSDDTPQANRLPGLIAFLKDLDSRRGAQVDRPLSAAIARAMEQADIRQSEKFRRVASYELVELLDEGDTWQDYKAVHRVSRVPKRARIHLRGRGIDDAERQAIDRAAEREFRLLARLHHPGIESPETLEPNPRGLATLYPFDDDAVRLDHWVDAHPDIDLYGRLALIREIAEAVSHAHEHGLAHRSLTPRHVWITDVDGTPTPRLRDWATVARDLGSTASSSPSHGANGTRHPDHLVRLAGADAGPYLAPELRTVPEASGRLADVFALGGLTHLLLTGQAPADDGDALLQVLDEHGSVPLAATMDAAPPDLVEVVSGATAFDVSDRFPSVSEFLAWLEIAEEELTSPDDVDLLSAKRGTQTGGWTITDRLGAGASSVVLRAERDGVVEVLKVARDEDHAERVRDEFEVLDQLRHPAIIAAHAVETISGHTVLRLQPGLVRRQGEAVVADTLAARLRQDGTPTLDLLQRWGNDLLDALVELERMGIDHRDLKPENMVFVERGKYKETHLALIDFSLSRASKTDLDAGTVGYIDPFLRDRPQRRWDLHAERYAAAVVLTELATGERPVWGDGADPRSTDLDVPDVHAVGIDPAIREPLSAVLERALHRDPSRRFDTADDFRRDWDRVFTDVDSTSGHPHGASADEIDLASVEPITTIAELGLAPRLVGAIERLGVATAGELARAGAYRMTGVGASVRRELRHLVRRLRDAGLADEPETLGELSDSDVARLSVDRLAERLVPRSNLTDERRQTLQALLGLDDADGTAWPTLTRTARATDTELSEVTAELERARKRWAGYRPELVVVRTEIAEWLATREGVATGEEVAELLLARRGSVADDPYRTRRARAVVRACVEAESTVTQPRFRGVRIASQLLVALDQSAEAPGRGRIDWDADALVEAAAALGEAAERLVDDGEVIAPAVALDVLRDIEWPPLPDGVAFDDLRLVQLAAAASTTAAVSSRGELYPRNLPAVRAAQAARLALLSSGGLTDEQIRQRVHARFPAAQPLPSRPELDAVLADAQVGLQWDVDDSRFKIEGATGWSTSRTPSWTTAGSTQYASEAERDAEAAELDRRLGRMRTEGGFVAATVDPRRLDLAARRLAARLDAPLVDLDAELISAMRAAAQTANARWDALVAADATEPGDRAFFALRQLVTRATPAVDARVRNAGEVVVATGAGLLARYDALDVVECWRDDLTRSLDERSTPLRGLVLLVPGTDRDHRPAIDGRPIPVETAGQWTRVPTSWLNRAA